MVCASKKVANSFVAHSFVWASRKAADSYVRVQMAILKVCQKKRERKEKKQECQHSCFVCKECQHRCFVCKWRITSLKPLESCAPRNP